VSTLVCPKCRLALQAAVLTCPVDGADAEAQSFPDLPGPLAQRFHLLAAFGHTPRSALFLAESQTSGRRGVLKLALTVRSGRDPEAQRARRELERQQKLSTLQLASPWESGLADGRPWLFRRMLSGETLRARLDRKAPIPLAEALRIAGECGIALEALHAQGLLHRDLHPGHVFLESTPGQRASAERVVVLDAGLPRITARADAPPMIGTPGYAAPEQLQGKLVTVRSDLYSLGVILAEMLQGAPVFAAENPFTILHEQLCDGLPTLSDSFPESVRAMIGALLRSDPQRRPLSAQRLRTTLAAYLLEGVPVTRQPNSHSTPLGEPSLPTTPAGQDPSSDLRPNQHSAAPPPPPAAAMRSGRPPAPPTANARPATRAPLPPPPTRKAEVADLTQQIDEHLLEEVMPPPRSMPPAPRSSAPPKPPRSTADNTVPVRLDQILAVSQTPRASAIPPPSPQVARSLPPQVSVMATTPSDDQGLESLLFGDVLEDESELSAHAGTLFDPNAAVLAQPPAAQELPLEPAPAPAVLPAQTTLGLPPADAFAPVAPHKATSLGLPNPVVFGAEQVAQAAQDHPVPTGVAAAFAVDEDAEASAEDELEADGQDKTTIFRSDPSLDLGMSDAIRPPPAEPLAAVAPPFNAANVAKLPPRDESGDDHTQPVRELQSSVRPADGDSQRKRYLGLGLAVAAALLLGVGGRALFRGGSESGETTAQSHSEDAPQEVGSAPTAESIPSTAAHEEVPTAAPRLADIDGPDEASDTPSPAAAIAPAGASVPTAAAAPADVPASGDGAPTVVAAVSATTVTANPPAASTAGEIRPVTTSPIVTSADSEPTEASRVRSTEEQRSGRASEAKSSAESSAASSGSRATRRKKAAEQAPATSAPAAVNPQQVAWTEARDEARRHYAARQYAKAAEAYERATRLDPQNPGTFAGLGAARLQLQNAKGAVEAYQRAVQLSPDTPGFHAALGRAYVAAGDSARARASYKRGQALDPDNAGIAKALAELD